MPATNTEYPFLSGGGEMGALTRNYDWEATAIGSPAQWPQSLRTTISIILNSKFPMFLFWGPEHICFYNDAYRPSLGNDGKHPGALGKPGAEVWPEIWAFIKPLIDQVLAGGGATWNEDQLLPIYRNGQMEDVYWTFSYSPVTDENGGIAGVFVTCTETTDKVVNTARLEESKNRLHFAIEASELATWELDAVTHRFSASPRLREWFGLPAHGEVAYTAAIAAVHEADREKVSAAIAHALEYESGGIYEVEHRLVHPQTGEERIVQAKGRTQFDANNKASLFNGTIQDVTTERKAAKALQDSKDQLHHAIEAAELATWDLNPHNNLFIASPRLKEWFGLKHDDVVPLQLAIESILESDRERVIAAIEKALSNESGGHYDIIYTIINPLTGQERIVRAKGQAQFDADGNATRFSGTVQDITANYKARQRIEQSQQQLLELFEQSPVAIATIDIEDLTFRTVNTFYASLVGRKPEQLIDKPLLVALPELEGQGFDDLLNGVIATGIPYRSNEVSVDLVRNEQLETRYVDLVYQPRRGANDEVTGVLVVATDVTEQVTARRQVEESEAQIRSLVESAPFPIGVYTGREMRIQLANQNILDVWGKGNDVIGKRYAEILPELEGTGIYEQLDGVYTTGIPYHSSTQRVDIMHDGVLKPYYFNYKFTPLFNAEGNVYGVMNTAADVTELALAQKQAEDAEDYLQSAIDVAELSTWALNIKENTFSYSPRFMEWLGFTKDTQPLDAAYNPLPEGYRESVPAAVAAAIAPGSNGLYNNEHPIVNRVTGQVRIIHAQAAVVYDADGAPIALRGMAQDVTLQRELQTMLEQQVQERTEELGAANEELASANEELFATNEELAQLNGDLAHSNEELAQYAYVASHDLQEPLRKIRIFSGILAAKHELSDDAKETLGKISESAERMALLIRDLLEFSRLLKSDSMMRSVDLNEAATAVTKDFELIIEEKKATVTISNLPVIDAVSLQMNQLFYNLLGNALKFSSATEVPQVTISSVPLSPEETGKYITRPIPDTQYHHITVSDNGIGFNVAYAEQIFEVFKRLHGRDSYPGSGIGLALCRRIVGNHNGHLFAESTEGEGSVFHLILPEKQEGYISSMPEGLKWKE